MNPLQKKICLIKVIVGRWACKRKREKYRERERERVYISWAVINSKSSLKMAALLRGSLQVLIPQSFL